MKIVECALPITTINQCSYREKTAKTAHGSNLHLWWGRSPEPSSLAVLAATMMEYSPEFLDYDLELLSSLAKGDMKAMKAVRICNGDDMPTVWDPFCGSGGIPLAAQKLGMNAIANDLNPVAVLLTRAVSEIPGLFASLPPVHPGIAANRICTAAQGIAEDVRFYGEWMLSQAQKRLKKLYYPVPDGMQPLAWVWVRTVKCHNPACNCRIPLASSFMLQNTDSLQVWAEPHVNNGEVNFTIRKGQCPEERKSNKIGQKGAKFICPACGAVITDDTIRKIGAAGGLGMQLMATVCEQGNSRIYIEPDELQCSAVNIHRPEDLPPGNIPRNTRWFSPTNYGFTEFTDLFTPRQLTMLCTFSDLVQEAQYKAASDALAAGMSAYGGNLENGANGAIAYGQAVGVYLALVVDKLANYNSTLCTWRDTHQNIRATFGRQALPMVWTFAEGNPFSSVAGNFYSLLMRVVDNIAALPAKQSTKVKQSDAVIMAHPTDVMVCTEMPYYRDIAYAELSDFFYIWLRRSLKGAYPKLFAHELTPKEELSTVSTYSGMPKEEGDMKYRHAMRQVCKKLFECSRSDVPTLLFWRFRRADMTSIECGDMGNNESAWELMLQEILDAGFSFSAIWPLRSEPASERADAMRVLIVANKWRQRTETATRRIFIASLKRELPSRLHPIIDKLEKEDMLITFMGQGLSIFTKYSLVLNADGSTMCIHDALQLIYNECINYITREDESCDQIEEFGKGGSD